MKTMISSCFKIVFLVILFAFSANGQKLPNVQEASLRAPAAIKIDGKATEWNGRFQAYNKAAEIFYTISNDNEKLYLTVQAMDLDIINKIICGGVTLTVSGSDKKGIAITFPIIDLELEKSTAPVRFRLKNGPPINLDKPADMPLESFIAGMNKELIAKSKEIAISGIKGIQDTLSIYNPEGIKVAILVDEKTSMAYELAVPLISLGLSVNDQEPVNYNIKLTGYNPNLNVNGELNSAGRAQRAITQYSIRDRPGGLKVLIPEGYPPALRILSLVSPTDFSGEYRIAK